jgi:hypothetical protein
MAGSGATPITPKNGRVTGTTTPGATAAVFAWRSIGDDALKETGELLGQRAGIGALGVEAIRNREIDLENADLKDIAQHRTVDEDRPGKNVRTGAAIRDFPTDDAGVFRDGARGNDAGRIDVDRIRAADRFDGDDVRIRWSALVSARR